MSDVDVVAIREALSRTSNWPWQIAGQGWIQGDGEWAGESSTRSDAELIVLLRNNAEALLDALEEAERRGAVRALRKSANNPWLGPAAQRSLTAQANEIEDEVR